MPNRNLIRILISIIIISFFSCHEDKSLDKIKKELLNEFCSCYEKEHNKNQTKSCFDIGFQCNRKVTTKHQAFFEELDKKKDSTSVKQMISFFDEYALALKNDCPLYKKHQIAYWIDKIDLREIHENNITAIVGDAFT